MKLSNNKNNQDLVETILLDIRNYLYQENKEYITTQHIAGMKFIYHGQVVKNWVNTEQVQINYIRKVNRIIIQQSVQFYSKVWTQRNEIMHNLEVFRTYLLEQQKNIKEMINTRNKPNMRKYL